MKSKVVVMKANPSQWVLSIDSYDVEGIQYHYREFYANKLYEIIDIANVLRLHIDNLQELPLTQYKEAM